MGAQPTAGSLGTSGQLSDSFFFFNPQQILSSLAYRLTEDTSESVSLAYSFYMQGNQN